jgi:hydrogenase expression/formation protein HypE
MTDERDKRILLAHGGGGRLTAGLIATKIVPRFANDALRQLGDAAAVEAGDASILFTTDSFVVKPLFFHGGDIGKLAVCGTVNDLAVAGARPVALSMALIIEEGFEMDLLDRILDSAAAAASQAGVDIVAGDTKVVERGAADGIYITTAGVGVPIAELSMEQIRTGDAIIINGTIGDHGMAIMSQRKGIEFETQIQSDCAALSPLTCAVLNASDDVRFMRDATRGGVAAVLNEIASGARHDIEIDEMQLPVSAAVQAAADMLGFDVLEIANEGKVVIVVSEASAGAVLEVCRSHELGRHAAVIGRVLEPAGREAIVEMATAIGGRRVVQMPYGRELPRIC